MSVQEQDIKENVAFHQYLFFPSITFCTFSYLLHLFVCFFFCLLQRTGAAYPL